MTHPLWFFGGSLAASAGLGLWKLVKKLDWKKLKSRLEILCLWVVVFVVVALFLGTLEWTYPVLIPGVILGWVLLEVVKMGWQQTVLWALWLVVVALMILGGALLLWVFLDPLTGIPLLTLGQAAVFVTLLPPALWGLNLGRRAVWERIINSEVE